MARSIVLIWARLLPLNARGQCRGEYRERRAAAPRCSARPFTLSRQEGCERDAGTHGLLLPFLEADGVHMRDETSGRCLGPQVDLLFVSASVLRK